MNRKFSEYRMSGRYLYTTEFTAATIGVMAVSVVYYTHFIFYIPHLWVLPIIIYSLMLARAFFLFFRKRILHAIIHILVIFLLFLMGISGAFFSLQCFGFVVSRAPIITYINKCKLVKTDIIGSKGISFCENINISGTEFPVDIILDPSREIESQNGHNGLDLNVQLSKLSKSEPNSTVFSLAKVMSLSIVKIRVIRIYKDIYQLVYIL
jgi:hypothetical protein